MSDINEAKTKKRIFRWSDLWSFPLTYAVVVAVEYVWNWVFEGALYVDWGDALRLTILVIIFVKVGEVVRNRGK